MLVCSWFSSLSWNMRSFSGGLSSIGGDDVDHVCYNDRNDGYSASSIFAKSMLRQLQWMSFFSNPWLKSPWKDTKLKCFISESSEDWLSNSHCFDKRHQSIFMLLSRLVNNYFADDCIEIFQQSSRDLCQLSFQQISAENCWMLPNWSCFPPQPNQNLTRFFPQLILILEKILISVRITNKW